MEEVEVDSGVDATSDDAKDSDEADFDSSSDAASDEA